MTVENEEISKEDLPLFSASNNSDCTKSVNFESSVFESAENLMDIAFT
jgi:hypothetical protein